MEQEVLLKIENVVKTYPGVQALKGITTTMACMPIIKM